MIPTTPDFPKATGHLRLERLSLPQVGKLAERKATLVSPGWASSLSTSTLVQSRTSLFSSCHGPLQRPAEARGPLFKVKFLNLKIKYGIANETNYSENCLVCDVVVYVLLY